MQDPSLRLQALLEERTAPDDLASSIFQERDLDVVIRPRKRNDQDILIFDDGRGPVAVDISGAGEILKYMLPPQSDAETVGYEAARDAIVQALNSS